MWKIVHLVAAKVKIKYTYSCVEKNIEQIEKTIMMMMCLFYALKYSRLSQPRQGSSCNSASGSNSGFG